MQNKHRTPVYQRPWFIVLIILIAICLIVLLINLFRPKDQDSAHEPTPPSAPTSAPVVPESPSPSPEEPERPVQNEGTDPNSLPSLTGYITYQNHDSSTRTLNVTAVIDQYLTSDGECHLALSQNGQTFAEATTSAVADVTASLCRPFAVSTANLASGTYDLTITITADQKTGQITSQITI